MEASAGNTNEMSLIVYGEWFRRRTLYRMQSTRNGPAFALDEPVLLAYHSPMERVNFCPVRDANPFFHLAEALWMMAGRRDTEFLINILPSMLDFSDDGLTFNAAYGFRLFEVHGDQLTTIGNILRNDPDSRQCVAQIWDVENDLRKPTKDKACNTQLTFRVVNDRLNMTVFNRSNDAVWGGVSGANVVHFSVFHEYVAALAAIEMGTMYVFSTNFHIYDNKQSQALRTHYAGPSVVSYDLYSQHIVHPSPIVSAPQRFREECVRWCEEPGLDWYYQNAFLRYTATPMYLAYKTWRSKEPGSGLRALEQASSIGASDWRRAAVDWLSRRT